MKSFFISTPPDNDFEVAVFATGSARPSTFLGAVENSLCEKRIIGRVLFDLLLTNGSNGHRYFAAVFDGHNLGDLRPVADPVFGRRASENSARALSQHLPDLDTSMLSPAMRFAVSRGRAL